MFRQNGIRKNSIRLNGILYQSVYNWFFLSVKWDSAKWDDTTVTPDSRAAVERINTAELPESIKPDTELPFFITVFKNGFFGIHTRTCRRGMHDRRRTRSRIVQRRFPDISLGYGDSNYNSSTLPAVVVSGNP